MRIHIPLAGTAVVIVDSTLSPWLSVCSAEFCLLEMRIVAVTEVCLSLLEILKHVVHLHP
jgi:hypothetical protein